MNLPGPAAAMGMSNSSSHRSTTQYPQADTTVPESRPVALNPAVQLHHVELASGQQLILGEESDPLPTDTSVKKSIEQPPDSSLLAETTTPVAPGTAEDLRIPPGVCASCIPKLPPPNTDEAETMKILVETCQVAVEMAKYIKRLTAWCVLYTTENGML